MLAREDRAGQIQRRALSPLRSPYSRPIAPPLISGECRTLFREPLQFIVMSVKVLTRSVSKGFLCDGLAGELLWRRS
jgi:hypothetical protein